MGGDWGILQNALESLACRRKNRLTLTLTYIIDFINVVLLDITPPFGRMADTIEWQYMTLIKLREIQKSMLTVCSEWQIR